MDFNLTSDQQFFKETIRSFVDKEIRPVASELEKSGTYPTEIVEKMVDLGWSGILIPEEYGGLGLILYRWQYYLKNSPEDGWALQVLLGVTLFQHG